MYVIYLSRNRLLVTLLNALINTESIFKTPESFPGECIWQMKSTHTLYWGPLQVSGQSSEINHFSGEHSQIWKGVVRLPISNLSAPQYFLEQGMNAPLMPSPTEDQQGGPWKPHHPRLPTARPLLSFPVLGCWQLFSGLSAHWKSLFQEKGKAWHLFPVLSHHGLGDCLHQRGSVARSIF